MIDIKPGDWCYEYMSDDMICVIKICDIVSINNVFVTNLFGYCWYTEMGYLTKVEPIIAEIMKTRKVLGTYG